MFCKNCGKELNEDAAFCPACGARQTENTDKESNPQDREKGVENLQSGEKDSTQNIISKIWNSPLFTKAAIKFGNVLEILEGVILFILAIALFQEGGFWGVVFGIIFLLAGIGSGISGAMSLISRRKSDSEDEILDEAAINKKKRNLCIGVVAIIILLIIVRNIGGGTYSIVKSITFDDMGSETIGELVDDNIKSPKWSQKKLDKRTRLVYVEGYCPAYGEEIKITFYCEKLKDGSYEVSLQGMYWVDDNKELNAFESSFVWASFYN